MKAAKEHKAQQSRVLELIKKPQHKVSQLQAYVGTRTLGIFGSSDQRSSGSTNHVMAGNFRQNHNGNIATNGIQIFNPNGNYNRFLVHAHLIFDNIHDFGAPVGNRDNIGYGNNGLFSENYQYRTIGHTLPNEERAYLATISAQEYFDTSAGSYDVMNHNCQSFVQAVYREYNALSNLI